MVAAALPVWLPSDEPDVPDCEAPDVAADDDPPEFCTCASCASSDLISALSLSMAVVVASLVDDDEPPPPPPPPPPDFFALDVDVVDVPDEVELLLDVPLVSVLFVLLVLLVLAVEFDALVLPVVLALLLAPAVLVLVVAVA